MVGVGAVWVHCFKCPILDTFGLNVFKRVPLLETIFGNLIPDHKAGHLKMSDLKRVDGMWEADGSRMDLLQVYNKILNLF